MNNRTQPDRAPINTTAFAFSDALRQSGRFDAGQWQKYIEHEIGFVLPDMQLQWLINAIECTAISNGLTLEQLWTQLPKNSELRQQFLDKVLIHESRFFRHKPSIDFVTKHALQHQNVNEVYSPFHIWSVGCASGQEAWSLAMSLSAEQLSNYCILGTDVSEQAIIDARLAQYDKRQQSLIPEPCQQFVQPIIANSISRRPNTGDIANQSNVSNNTQPSWQIASVLKPYVNFAVHNIIEQQSPTSHLQNVIICQNMLLYFRKFDQRDILARLSEQCALEGYIILAPGEALFWRPSNMRRIAHPQVNVWQKISA